MDHIKLWCFKMTAELARGIDEPEAIKTSGASVSRAASTKLLVMHIVLKDSSLYVAFHCQIRHNRYHAWCCSRKRIKLSESRSEPKTTSLETILTDSSRSHLQAQLLKQTQKVRVKQFLFPISESICSRGLSLRNQ
jgi:hypothetical protein